MNKKKLTRLIAVCTACLGMGVFALSGCKKDDGTTPENPGTEATTPTTPTTPTGPTTPTTPETPGSGTTTPTTPETPGSGSSTTTPTTPETPGSGSSTTTPETPGGGGSGTTSPGTGSDTSKPGEPIGTPPEAEIKPVAGGPVITKASAGELETAYVEWTAAENAKWYNVYVKAHDAADTAYTKLDGPLVREYKDKENKTYYRADALGLKAGQYDMKVVPVSTDDTEATQYAAPANSITVYSQDRAGYAFTGGNVPGAYNMDGTLKTGAQVVYVTAATAKTVTATVNGATVTGFQSIIDARQKNGLEQSPLCFRIVGTVKKDDLDHISSSAEGLQIKGTDKNPAANITIEGVGNDGTINGFGMLIRNSKNIEVSNLGVINFMDDGISLDTANSHLWIHNLDIFYGNPGGDSDQAKGDGSLDSKGTDYSTYSYNHFWDSGKSNLLGNGDSEKSGEGGATHLTYHHNWYDHSDSRHPRIRTATVHVYNNYFDGNSKYGVGSTMDSDVFIEKNYFRSTTRMKPILTSNQGTDISTENEKGETKSNFGETGGSIKAFGNTYDCPANKLLLLVQSSTKNEDAGKGVDCWEAASRDEKVPDSYTAVNGGAKYNNFDTASDFYKYSVDTAEQAKEKVQRYAGRVDGGDLTWTFDNATEDSNYGIISGLKAAVVGYKSSVVKIGGATVSGGGSTGGSTGGNTGGESGGDTPVTPTTPTLPAGTIVYTPQTDGTTKTGFVITGNTGALNDASKDDKKPATINGVSYTTGLKMESSTKIEFTPSQDMTLKVYVSVANALKVAEGSGSATSKAALPEDGVYVLTLQVSAGIKYTISKDAKSCLYFLTLTPKA